LSKLNIPDSSPHADHGTRVVVGLKKRALLSLQQDNGGVDNLVELGEVEPPSVPSERILPKTLNLNTRGDESSIHHGSVAHKDSPGLLTDLAQASDRVLERALVERVVHSPHHSDKGPSRVDCEEDIVKNDEDLEDAGVGNAVRLSVGAVVEEVRGNGVDGGNGERYPYVKSGGVNVGGNGDVVGDNERGLASGEGGGERRGREGEVDHFAGLMLAEIVENCQPEGRETMIYARPGALYLGCV
jgi:hypothetical protein